jgi:hypothetical protein
LQQRPSPHLCKRWRRPPIKEGNGVSAVKPTKAAKATMTFGKAVGDLLFTATQPVGDRCRQVD